MVEGPSPTPSQKNGESRSTLHQAAAMALAGCAGFSIMQAMNFPTFGVPSMDRDPSSPIPSGQSAWLAAVVPAAAAVGNVVAGLLVDVLGRRGLLWLGSVIYAAAWLLLAVASTAAEVVASRVLTGVGASLLMVGGMVYTAETVQPSLRDRLGSIAGLLLNAGMLAAFVAGKVVEWRGMAWLGLLGLMPMLPLLLLLPESPVYLIRRGRNKEALASLCWLRSSDTEATKEWKEMLEFRRSSSDSEISLREMFSPPYSTPVLVSLMLILAQQMTGVTGITTYSVSIFKAAGTSIDPETCTIMIAVVNIVTTLVSAEIDTRFNRKPTLMVSTMFVVNLQICIGLFFWARTTDGQLKAWADANGIIPLVLIIMFFVAYGLGLGPLPWKFMSEGMPSRIRGPGSAIASTFNWIAVFIVIQLFDASITSLGYHYTFFIFAFVTAATVSIIYPFMLETRGMSVTDVDNYYSSAKKTKKD